MAPEQGNGQWERTDDRVDVFGLGGILCAILTGQPPYVGSSDEVFRKAQRGDLAEAFARLDGCAADAALVALARHCLAAAPEERPANAAEVAAALTGYQRSVTQRLRQAEMERAQAQVKAAEQRKRHRVQLTLGAMLFVVLLGGGLAGWLWREQERARRQQADSETVEAMTAARLLGQQAEKAPPGERSPYRQAVAAARKAEELARSGGASPDVQRQAAELLARLQGEEKAAERDRRLLVALLDVYQPREARWETLGRDLFQMLGRHRRALFALLDTDTAGVLVRAELSPDERFQSAFQAWGLDVERTPTADAAQRLQSRQSCRGTSSWRR
jgi:serine/threonine-protein kinase